MKTFKEIQLKLEDFTTEEGSAPGTVTANIPNPVDTMQGTTGAILSAESCDCDYNPDESFLGFPVFQIPDSVHRNFRTGKNRYHRWDRYLDMSEDSCKKVYEYAKRNPKTSLILKNGIGAMIYVRPDKHLQ